MYISICLSGFIILMFTSFNFFFLSLYFIINDLVIFIEWEIISVNSSLIVMTLLFDWMSLLFMSFVLFISALVIFYSNEYMSGDLNLNRFIQLVFMFILSMMFVIISPNLISILLGWDGLGLVSYCLVIYYQNHKSYNAGMLTALSNRVGDVALLMAIAWMLNYGSWNYIYYLESMKMHYEMQFISFMVILAAMTKSAQIPFSAWLPAAMAAPTPVSALVHSSTLVTAGVYLLIRFNLVLVDTILTKFLLLISVLTMFMSGLGANYEFDLKKIIALSTLSQLGLMMSILCLGYSTLAFFHLLVHALFKALLFMCAGSIIHNMKNNQDIRLMGSIVMSLPLTSSCMNIANLALCGMPFLAGFYSKDLILESLMMSSINIFIFYLYFLSIGLTVMYSLRLTYYTITGNFNFMSLNSINDLYLIMLKGMLGLVFLAIMSGSILSWLIFPTPLLICLPIYMKLLTVVIIILGGGLGYELFQYKISWNKFTYNYIFLNFLSSLWFMPFIVTIGMNKKFLIVSYQISKSIDQGWNEYLGAQSMYFMFQKKSKIHEFLMNNEFKIYYLLFILMIVFIMMMHLIL
uniref:NADH-ubiquinone oxidoreductase chain 5 n=1 Tax=Neuronema laminatum TaxID=1701416 RepID=A0A0U2GJ22_NEULA|nr:NADH dehydrogenase subunit 5 [Neuronema laminatum]AKZ17620.1 NADH dehydrogenase subunit 5 [Neuronema laminatum]